MGLHQILLAYDKMNLVNRLSSMQHQLSSKL